MKHITLLITLLTIGFITTTYAQADSTSVLNKKHEFKIGAIKLLAGGILDVTYERIHSEDFTYGISLLGNLDSKNNEYPEDFSVTPFARFYFTEPKYYGARGFFIEGFGKFIAGRDYNGYVESYYVDNNGNGFYSYRDKQENYTAASVGISLGWKWINRSGFVFEILAGGGRNFGGSNAPDASFRGDFNLGYRF